MTTKDSRDRATRNREIRQQAVREQLQADQLVRQILARVHKLDDGVGSLDAQGIAAIKAANDASLRLLNKVLPDLKAVEHSGANGGPIETVNMLDPSRLSPSALRELLALHEQSQNPG